MAVLTGDRIINIICKSLNNSPQYYYMTAPSEFLNKSACDVLYLPKVALSEYPPIIIEVQKKVNEKYMSRATRYSILVYEKYSKYPLLLHLMLQRQVSLLKLKPLLLHHPSLPNPLLLLSTLQRLLLLL